MVEGGKKVDERAMKLIVVQKERQGYVKVLKEGQRAKKGRGGEKNTCNTSGVDLRIRKKNRLLS